MGSLFDEDEDDEAKVAEATDFLGNVKVSPEHEAEVRGFVAETAAALLACVKAGKKVELGTSCSTHQSTQFVLSLLVQVSDLFLVKHQHTYSTFCHWSDGPMITGSIECQILRVAILT
jgi:hypothetical protein